MPFDQNDPIYAAIYFESIHTNFNKIRDNKVNKWKSFEFMI